MFRSMGVDIRGGLGGYLVGRERGRSAPPRCHKAGCRAGLEEVVSDRLAGKLGPVGSNF